MQALEVTEHLLHRGHTVWLSCLPGSRLATEAAARNVPVLPLNVRGYVHPVIIARLARFLHRENVAIIHTDLSKDLATLVPAMKLSGTAIPILLTKQMGSYITKKDSLHRFTYAHVRRVIAISDFVHQNVIDTTPIPPSRVLTIHPAIDLSRYELAQAQRASVRRALGVDDRTLLIGHVARFSPGKGHEDLLHALKFVFNQRDDVRCIIIGEASYGEEAYEKSIKELAHTLGVSGMVNFLGFRRDVPNLLGAMDVFAFPSHAEAFGLALIEAMAMERPVVSTNSYGVVDIVVNGLTGLTVPPRSPEQFAAALLQLLNDPQLRITMGKAGRARVEELFERQKQLDRIERVYREVIGERQASKDGV